MCCTITIPGASGGSTSSSARRASVPPVDAPTTTTFSVVSSMAPVARGRMASAVSLGSTVWLAEGTRKRAAGRCLDGLAKHDARFLQELLAAQARLGDDVHRAVFQRLSVLCAPSSARLEQMTTGMGCWLMIFCRNVSPSMRGISISSVITSGICSAILSAATKGSPAVPITSMAGSADRISPASGGPRRNRPRSVRGFFGFCSFLNPLAFSIQARRCKSTSPVPVWK